MNDKQHDENGLTESERFWEHHYQQHTKAWSGQANETLIRFATPLRPGSALELGCAGGGDAIWLGQQSWRVTAVDVSTTVLRHAAAQAAAYGVADRIDFQQHDLAYTFPTGSFDLVSALFFQTPITFPRARVLQTAAAAVAFGGLLLIVDHASTAPWSWNQDPDQRFPTPQEVLDMLELDPAHWHTEFLGAPTRQASGPNGMTAEVIDNIVAVRRLPDQRIV